MIIEHKIDKLWFPAILAHVERDMNNAILKVTDLHFGRYVSLLLFSNGPTESASPLNYLLSDFI